MIFDRILTARHSVANKCFAKDGEVLFFRPRKMIPSKDLLNHHFVSVRDTSVKSKYGWVSFVEPISVDDFARTYFHKSLDSSQVFAIEIMLTAIANLAEGTPVSVQYVQRGIEQKRMDITIHKVFFYGGKKDK